MKIRATVLLMVAGGVMAAYLATSPALAGDESAYSYVGSRNCKKCHVKQHSSWKATKMGKAFDTLRPGKASEAKGEYNLDANEDFTRDEACLKCHTVGFGKPGGYTITTPKGKKLMRTVSKGKKATRTAPKDRKAMRTARTLMNVGCESCHGPGSGYVKVFDEIMKSKRKYKVEELYAVGLHKIDESTCTACHNDKSPTNDAANPFDYETGKDEGIHEHLPLEQREE